MTPRGLLTTIGATALGFGIVVAGAPAVSTVFAQETTTPAAEAPAQAAAGADVDFEAQRAQAYDSFVAALASELGDDEAAVDAAIRTVLKQQVDAQQAAGDLDAERAAAIKAVIDVTEAPLFSGFGGRGGIHGIAGHDGGRGPGMRGGFEGHGPRGRFDGAIGALPVDGSSPAMLPAEGSASDQRARPGTPAEDVAL
jgi:hypothetical protein